MSEGTEQHLEHAEHAQHAAHNPFDRMVAMSMAIIAAGLAGVAMVSHRGHNETLLLQSKTSNDWSFYQAKNIRSATYQSILINRYLENRPPPREQDPSFKPWAYLVGQVDKYEGKGYWDNLVTSGFQPRTKGGAKIRGGELAELQDMAKQRAEEGHHVHAHVNWFDSGQLGLELALVLCSVAVLTKQRSFWFLGVAIGVAGMALALYGVYGLYLAPGHS